MKLLALRTGLPLFFTMSNGTMTIFSDDIDLTGKTTNSDYQNSNNTRVRRSMTVKTLLLGKIRLSINSLYKPSHTGDIIQALAASLNLEDLTALANFPLFIEDLKDVRAAFQIPEPYLLL